MVVLVKIQKKKMIRKQLSLKRLKKTEFSELWKAVGT